MNDEHDLIRLRRQQLQQQRETGGAFKNDFKRNALAAELTSAHADKTKAELATAAITVAVAGRMMTRRVMGKAAFVHIQDSSGQIQLYIRADALAPGRYQDEFKSWDIGDILGAAGTLMKTNKGELSIQVTQLVLLTKSLRPLPEKFHGLTDTETRYRLRYLDLIMNAATRKRFRQRAEIIDFIRTYLKAAQFIEVETPIMHPLVGGANAKPFETYHHSLNRPLFLRIAPELYLKRLIIGGFERVFELNRSFRNEGLSPYHNPEFTMLEFYQAYATYHELMDLTEALLRQLTIAVHGHAQLNYQGQSYDLAKPFARLTLAQAICQYHPGITASDLHTVANIRRLAEKLSVAIDAHDSLGKIQLAIFDKTVVAQLLAPTFITDYPIAVSPLARRNDKVPELADRFELFMCGTEIANGFSELNDPEDQAARFLAQVAAKNSGDSEAMAYDQDYITALEYGMPPTAGEGIGIDRLVMLLTDAATIKEVIFFPQMRSQS